MSESQMLNSIYQKQVAILATLGSKPMFTPSPTLENISENQDQLTSILSDMPDTGSMPSFSGPSECPIEFKKHDVPAWISDTEGYSTDVLKKISTNNKTCYSLPTLEYSGSTTSSQPLTVSCPHGSELIIYKTPVNPGTKLPKGATNITKYNTNLAKYNMYNDHKTNINLMTHTIGNNNYMCAIRPKSANTEKD